MPAASVRDLPARGRRRACRSRSRAGCSARHAPFVLRPRLDPHQWRWLIRFLRNCAAERFARNKARMQRIAHYSKACLDELREETGIAFDHGTGGVLQLFRTEEELAGGREIRARARPVRRRASHSGWRGRPRGRAGAARRGGQTRRAACIFPMTRPATATCSRARSPSFCVDAASRSSSTRP